MIRSSKSTSRILIPLHDVFELDRIEQIVKILLGRSICIAEVCEVGHTTGQGGTFGNTAGWTYRGAIERYSSMNSPKENG